MTLKEKILAFFRHFTAAPAPAPKAPLNLSKRHQRHEFIILQVVSHHLFKVKMNGREELLDLGDWRFFKHELANWCQANRIYSKVLAEGGVNIHCVGTQENVERGIRFVWRFSKL